MHAWMGLIIGKLLNELWISWYKVAHNLVFVDFYYLRKDVEIMSQLVEEIKESSGLQLLEQELANLEEQAADSSFWDSRAKAQDQTLSTLADVKDKV